MLRKKHDGFTVLEGLLILLVFIVIVGVGIYVWHRQSASIAGQNIIKSSNVWTFGGQALVGDNYAADPDVVKLDNGQYRMYYGQSPEKPGAGHSHPILSAISTDGKTFKPEAGVRLASGAFPDVIHLSNGSWRMYYQGSNGIDSASSSDGLNWTQDPGIRVSTTNPDNLSLYQVGAPTIMQQKDGTFVMVYSGYINKRYNSKVPNKDTHLFLWATSKDGLKFSVKGIAIESRNSTYQGWLDGPEWADWNGTWRLFYWGYAGIYFDTFNGSSFSSGQLVYEGQNASSESMAQFQPHPPGDPTLMQIGNTWYLYYDMTLNNGNDLIYYATQKT